MLEQKLAQHRQTIRERNFTIAEAKHLLDTLSKNNRETELSLSKARRRAFRLQQDVKEREKSCSRLKDEVRAARGSLARCLRFGGELRGRFCVADGELQSCTGQSDLRRGGREVRPLPNEARDGGKHSEVGPVPRPTTVKALCGTRAVSVRRLEDAAINNVALEEKLKELTQSSLNQEDRAARMDQFLNEEELAMRVGSPTKTASSQIKTYLSSSNYWMPFCLTSVVLRG